MPELGVRRRKKAALVALALLASLESALADARRVSLFTNEPQSPIAVRDGLASPKSSIGEASPESPLEEAGGGPSLRLAELDFKGLDGIREAVESGSRANLRLNLLHDAEFDAVIERSAPTSSGYSLSGPLSGVPFGRMVLVVNDGHAMGRVYTPEGLYVIRTAGSMQTVAREEPAPLRCATGEKPVDETREWRPDGPVEPHSLGGHPGGAHGPVPTRPICQRERGRRRWPAAATSTSKVRDRRERPRCR